MKAGEGAKAEAPAIRAREMTDLNMVKIKVLQSEIMPGL
jgi:hypothetical protein